MCQVSSTRLTHELVSLFAVATARKLYFLTTEFLFEAGIDTPYSLGIAHNRLLYLTVMMSIFNPFWVAAADQGVVIETIMKMASWTCAETLATFYKRPIQNNVLPKFPLGEDRSTSSKISGVPSKTCDWMGYNRNVKRTLPVRWSLTDDCSPSSRVFGG